MNLDTQFASQRASDTAAQQHDSVIGEFAGGLGSHLKAPFVGLSEALAGTTFDNSAGKKAPVPESGARMAGEMVADAVIFLGATAILKRVPALGSLAPAAAGGVLGLIEPLKNGEGLEQRLVHGAEGAGTMLVLDKGPALLANTGLISSEEKSLTGAFVSGALVGGATEQVNIYSRTGHLASLGQTANGALSFGLTTTAFQGLGNVLAKRAENYGVRSRAEDATSILPSLPSLKDFLRLNPTEKAAADEGWHLVLGSGGSKAALSGAGVVLATRAAKLKISKHRRRQRRLCSGRSGGHRHAFGPAFGCGEKDRYSHPSYPETAV